MLAAIKEGDAKKVAELMRQDPGFDVNMVQDESRSTLLHYACSDNRRSTVIPLLLARPDIDVNAKDSNGCTPFYYACGGYTSCVREMLKDSRVKVNEPANGGATPIWRAAYGGHLDIIMWWIASGREIDLGKPGDLDKTDAIGVAKRNSETEVVTLLEKFKENPNEIRHAVRVQLGLVDEPAAEMFALVVFVSDGLLQIKHTTTPSPAARFFSIARSLPFLKSSNPNLDFGSQRFFRISAQLPLELQMVLCYRLVGSGKEIITGKDARPPSSDWCCERMV